MVNCVGVLNAELVNWVGVFARGVELVNFVGVLRAEMVALVLTPTDQMQRPNNFYTNRAGLCLYLVSKSSN